MTNHREAEYQTKRDAIFTKYGNEVVAINAEADRKWKAIDQWRQRKFHEADREWRDALAALMAKYGKGEA